MFVSDADFIEKPQFFPWQNLKSSWSRNSPSCFRFSGLCCYFYLSQGNGRKKEAGHRGLCREGQLVDLGRLGQSRGTPPPHPLPAGPFPPPGAGGGAAVHSPLLRPPVGGTGPSLLSWGIAAWVWGTQASF